MELIDIIVHSLKLFALTSFIVLIISYTIFKIKDRNRIKPYMVATSPSTPAPIIFEEEQSDIKEVVHEKKVKIEAVDPALERRRERFKIINRKTEMREKTIIDEPVIKVKAAKKEAAAADQDIYNLYSENSITPMHKLKLAGL